MSGELIFFFFFFFKIYLFILFFGCGGSSLLQPGFLQLRSYGERGLLFVVVRGLLIAGASVVAHRLSCSMAYGIFLEQGSN